MDRTLYFHYVRVHPKKKPLSLGDLIQSGFRSDDKRRAEGVIRLAAKTRLVVFRGQRQFFDFLTKT